MDQQNVVVEAFSGLLVDYAAEKDASVLVRGLRAVSDFEYEFQMAQMNRHLDSSLETIFLMPNEKYFYTSSQLIKQVHLFGKRGNRSSPRECPFRLTENQPSRSWEGLSQ